MWHRCLAAFSWSTVSREHRYFEGRDARFLYSLGVEGATTVYPAAAVKN
jgi:hypothetical protein